MALAPFVGMTERAGAALVDGFATLGDVTAEFDRVPLPIADASANLKAPVRMKHPSISAGARKLDWAMPRERGHQPTQILVAADRILINAEMTWELLSGSGSSLARGRKALGVMTVDAARTEFCFVDSDGFHIGLRFGDAGRSFRIPAVFGARYMRTFIHRGATRLVSAGTEAGFQPEMGRPASWLLETMTPPKPGTSVRYANPTLLCGAFGEQIVLVGRDRIYTLDESLRFTAIRSAQFEPLALAVDDSGWSYLAVSTSEGSFLWTLTRDFDRVRAVPIPAGSGPYRLPPLIDSSGNAYALGERAVVMVAPTGSGSVGWTRAFAAPLLGGFSLTDGIVLAAGRQVLHVASSSGVSVMFEWRETIRTAPALLPDGAMVVSSDSTVMRIAAA